MAKTTANDIQKPSLTPRIVIIGAGIASLSAARVLHQSGFHDVQVLEALDRVGGRINTVTCEKGIIDMGAQFIHGHKDNIIYNIAQANDLVLLPSDEYYSVSSDSEGRERHPPGKEDSKGRLSASYSEQGLFFTSNGDNISSKLVQELMRVFDKISENGDLFYERYVEKRKMLGKKDGNMSLDGDPGSEQSYLSYGEFIDKCFNDYMETCNDSPYMEQIKKAFNNYVFYLECIDCGCKSLYNLSLEGWGKYSVLEGSYNTEVKQGFSSVLNIYLNDIPSDIIHLSKPVACVQWKHCGDALEAANDSSQSKNPTSDAVDVNPNKSEEGFNANQNTKARKPKLDGGDACPNPRTEEQNSKGADLNSNTLGSKKLADGDAKLNPRFGKPRAVIRCDDGTSYEADHVIVTSSLGFLKSNHLTFFQPRLPATRQSVIEHAGFGTVNKVFLVWNQPFWSKDDGFTGYQFLWLDNIPVHVPSAKSQLRTSDLSHGEDVISARHSFPKSSFISAVIPSAPDAFPFSIALMAFFTSVSVGGSIFMSRSWSASGISARQFGSALFSMLWKDLGSTPLAPSRISRTAILRAANLFLDSEAMLKVGRYLYFPFTDPVLLFAGEAYSSRHFSSAHGAVQTGEDAARTILNMYNK
ncbi:peroxisomal N(1)-acetyl-spermine/spermidine oxidase-like [Gigantopelta aegis]|uniref:peroxisomal N(1)-acetyl-spermine/spermidine oxidase-like n=1 Tax=Gigantopelta aegis TaxID=1735272 RepID=UPI001B887EDD|nr:peroxisomal N(1)-acetyl-spermine/spermidine oxidase-like [Gigantopelta aegis]